MRGVDDDEVDAGVDQPLGALVTGFADGGGGCDPEPSLRVLAGERMGDRLLHVLYGDQSDAAVLIVDHEQLFDAMLVQHPLGLVLAHAFAHRDEVLVRHQLRDFLTRIGRKAHVAVGQDADELAGLAGAAAGHHGNAGEAVLLHQGQCIGQHGIGADGERVHHHAGLVLLHLPHLGGLSLRIEIAMDHADAAGLRHGDRHARLGDGIHGGGDDRDVERDRARDVGADVDFRGEHVRMAGFQEDVVERERFAKSLDAMGHCQLLKSAAFWPR